jgi:putative two-component system response regulator
MTMSKVILAVDNAPMFLSTLQRLLKDEPYELHCVTSDDEALEYLAKNQPALVLLDVEMPGMGGYALAKEIKGRGQSAPILFVSAHAEQEYADKAREAGAAGLLVKPLRRVQLLEKLAELTRNA